MIVPIGDEVRGMKKLSHKQPQVDAVALFDSFDSPVVQEICARLTTDYGIRTMTPDDIDDVYEMINGGLSCVIFVGQHGTGPLGEKLTAAFGTMRSASKSTGAIIPVLLPGGTWEYVKASLIIGSLTIDLRDWPDAQGALRRGADATRPGTLPPERKPHLRIFLCHA